MTPSPSLARRAPPAPSFTRELLRVLAQAAGDALLRWLAPCQPQAEPPESRWYR